jgi:hypothetical protein
MPDYLHLSARGYEIWAKAVEPEVKNLMEKSANGTGAARLLPEGASGPPVGLARRDEPAGSSPGT